MKNFNQKTVVRKNGTLRVQSINNEPTLAQQQFKDECDINNIMKKYSTTGEFTHLTSKEGVYADFSQITDYRDMLDTVIYAQDAFNALPAEMRKRFDNDPGKLLEFIQDNKNYDEGVKLGLLNPRSTANPIKNDDSNNDPKHQKQKVKPDTSDPKTQKNSDGTAVE